MSYVFMGDLQESKTWICYSSHYMVKNSNIGLLSNKLH